MSANLDDPHLSVESNCPYCGYKMDCATGVTTAGKPEPRDFSICIYCLEILQFDNEMKLTKPYDGFDYLERNRANFENLKALIRKAKKEAMPDSLIRIKSEFQ